MSQNRPVSRPAVLSGADLAARLATLPGWTHADGRLHRTFQFRDFSEAFGWMTRVALYAERRDHHPDWTNVYSRVAVSLQTHDAAGVTELDVELAREMDRLFSGAPAPAGRPL